MVRRRRFYSAPDGVSFIRKLFPDFPVQHLPPFLRRLPVHAQKSEQQGSVFRFGPGTSEPVHALDRGFVVIEGIKTANQRPNLEGKTASGGSQKITAVVIWPVGKNTAAAGPEGTAPDFVELGHSGHVSGRTNGFGKRFTTGYGLDAAHIAQSDKDLRILATGVPKPGTPDAKRLFAGRFPGAHNNASG